MRRGALLPFLALFVLEGLLDKLGFYEACRRAEQGHRAAGIGTLSEKTVHAVMKHYFCPHEDSHEQKIGPFIADIAGENGIIEIQTGSFSRLDKKLGVFLEYCPVTVVYPCAATKKIICMDPSTGVISSSRRSPKKADEYTVFRELESITKHLTHPNFRLCIVLMDMDELRCPHEFVPNQKKKRRKGAFSTYDRIPRELVREIHIDCPADWYTFLPQDIPDEFTTADLAAAGMDRDTARLVMNVFYKAGIAVRTGKRGRSYTYRKNSGYGGSYDKAET